MSTDLAQAIRQLAAQREIVVATDFDGVLAPLVDDPLASRPLPESLAHLRDLMTHDGVTVALVSGRDLDTLLRLSGVDPASEAVHAFGSHGAQSSHADDVALDADEQAALDGLDTLTADHVTAHPGARVEVKPTARVVHTRGMDPDAARAATDSLLARVQDLPGVHVLTGKDVVELAVRKADKGTAVMGLKAACGATGVFYAGDDRTDELVFALLGPGDVGVKVGPGDTAAQFRVDSPEAVVDVFAQLADAVRAHR